MKKTWLLSSIVSLSLLGGVLMPMGSYAAAADDVNPTYSDEFDIYEEDTITDDNWYEDFAEEEPELTAEQQEFENYLNQVFALESYEEKAFAALESIGSSVNSSNRKSMYLKLTNTVIPNYTKYVSKLKQIKPTNPELKKIHATYVKGSYNQLEGYLLYKKAVSKTKVNYTLLKQGNAKVTTGDELLDYTQLQLYAYARKMGYDI
ncbi:DNA-directed RNA polymerase subunit F [Paenibacillus sp. PvP094]|uniref:hypothetical protein n=1 Tax=Paenibacillus sp. PvP094 TaxID=3156394 RepID=UPI003398EE0A